MSLRWEGPSIDEIVRKAKDDALRLAVTEAATREATQRDFGEDWTIEVTMNMDDGSTVKATVVKAADGEAHITAWEPNAQREDADGGDAG